MLNAYADITWYRYLLLQYSSEVEREIHIENEMICEEEEEESEKDKSNNKMVKADIYCLKQHFYVIACLQKFENYLPV